MRNGDPRRGARPRQLVVMAGTGTEVGKTWTAARLLETWRAQGRTVAARKPVQSFALGDDVPTDAEVLGSASGETPETVSPPERWYPLAMAPPMAARRLGRPAPTMADLLDELRWPVPTVDVGLVETAGGLRSPQGVDGDALDMARALSPDLVLVVAHAGLGTVHAVRLVAGEMARHRLPYVVVLNRFSAAEPVHTDNLDWLRRIDGIKVTPGDRAGIEELAGRLSHAAVKER